MSCTNIDDGAVFLAAAAPEHQMAVLSHRPLGSGAPETSVVTTEVQAAMLLQKIRKLGRLYGSLAIIVEDNLRYPSDQVSRDNLAGVRYQLGDRFLIVNSLDSLQSTEHLARQLGQSSGYSLNAFIVPLASIPHNITLNELDAKHIAASVRAIINAAFDGETCIIWFAKQGQKNNT